MLSSMWYDWDAFDRLVREAFEAVNVHSRRTDDGIGYEFDLPGVSEDDIDITFDSGTLTVRGERNGRTMIRTVSVPNTVEVDKAEAEYKNGVLRIAMPIAEAAKPKRIQVRKQKELT